MSSSDQASSASQSTCGTTTTKTTSRRWIGCPGPLSIASTTWWPAPSTKHCHPAQIPTPAQCQSTSVEPSNLCRSLLNIYLDGPRCTCAVVRSRAYSCPGLASSFVSLPRLPPAASAGSPHASDRTQPRTILFQRSLGLSKAFKARASKSHDRTPMGGSASHCCCRLLR